MIVHFVGFGFKPGTPAETIQDVCQRMLALQNECLHPQTQKPYIRSGVGGKDSSPEKAQRGITHAFVVEFESEKDRDYYVHEDPVHRSFVASIGGIVDHVQVNDFSPGVF